MGKFHELLATEASRESIASDLVKQVVQTFKNKEGLFNGKTRILRMFGKTEENQVEMTAIEEKGSTKTPVSATPADSINYVAVALADFYDVIVQKECTNQKAVESVTIDGKIILENVPSVFLLGMETKLKAVREIILAIPTRPTGKLWEPAEDIGKDIFKSEEVTDIKTEKSTDYRVIPQPTEKFPSQHVTVETVKNVGEYKETSYTSLISSADKAKLLERIDTLLIEVKKARQRANQIDTVDKKVGDNIMQYLFGDWYDRSKRNTESKV